MTRRRRRCGAGRSRSTRSTSTATRSRTALSESCHSASAPDVAITRLPVARAASTTDRQTVVFPEPASPTIRHCAGSKSIARTWSRIVASSWSRPKICTIVPLGPASTRTSWCTRRRCVDAAAVNPARASLPLRASPAVAARAQRGLIGRRRRRAWPDPCPGGRSQGAGRGPGRCAGGARSESARSGR